MFLKSDWTKHTYFYFTLILSLLVLFFATFLLTFEKKESIDAVKQIESYVVVYFNGDWQEWRHAVDDTYTVNGYTIYGANGDYGVDSGTSNRFDWSDAWVNESSESYSATGINSPVNSWNAVQFKVYYNNFRSEYYNYSVQVKYSGDDRVYQTINSDGTLSSNGQEFDIGSKVSSVFNSLICCRAYFDVTPKSFPVEFYTSINKQQKDRISNSVSWKYGDVHTVDSSITNTVKSKNYTGYHWDQENTWWDGDFKQQNGNGAIVMYTKDDCKFYANFVPNTYTIKYDGNGATGGSTASSSHTYDSSKNLTKNGFEKKGYHFVGWSTSKNGSKAYSDGQSVKNLTSTNGGTITLYAKWEPNTYTVKFNANGGSGSIANQSLAFDSVLNIPNPTKKGYKFTGWSVTSGLDTTTAKSGTSNSLTALTKWDGTKTKNTYFANLTAKNKGTVELSAQWESYVLTYSFNSDDGSSHTGGTAYYGSTITLPTPTKTGYTFIGWKHNNNNNVYQAGGYSVNSDIANGSATVIFIAQWQANKYTINLNLQGGSGVTSPINATYDKVINIPNPAKTGYTFTGWSATSGLNKTTAKSGTSNSLTALTNWGGAATKNTYFANLTAAVNGAVTLTAKWTAITYTIEFNSNDGSGNTQNQTFTYDSEKALSKNTFKRAGYIFKEWNTEKNGTGTSYLDKAIVKNLTSTQGTTVTLYAQWEETIASNIKSTFATAGTYYISTAEDLAKLIYTTEIKSIGNGYFFIQTADIDLSGLTYLPIGRLNSFSGTYDGQGNIISGITTYNGEDANNDYLETNGGLFANASGAKIKNVIIENATIYGQNAGIIAGSGSSSTTISGCIVSGNVNGTNKGSIIGNGKGAKISVCLAKGVNTASFASGSAGIDSCIYELTDGTKGKSSTFNKYSEWIYPSNFAYPMPKAMVWYPYPELSESSLNSWLGI